MEEQQQPQTADITGTITTYCTCEDEAQRPCAFGECTSFDIEDFCECVNETMFTNHYGEYLWEGRRNSDVKRIKDAKEFLQNLTDRVGDYTIRWTLKDEKLSINFSHHDAPVGSMYYLSKVTFTPCAICAEEVINEDYALDTLSTQNPNIWKPKQIVDGIVYCCDVCAKYATQPHYITTRAVSKNVLYENMEAVIAVNMTEEEAEEGTRMVIQAKDLYNNDGFYLGTIGFISSMLQGNTWEAISITGIEFV
jgi:hypothetical protein